MIITSIIAAGLVAVYLAGKFAAAWDYELHRGGWDE